MFQGNLLELQRIEGETGTGWETIHFSGVLGRTEKLSNQLQKLNICLLMLSLLIDSAILQKGLVKNQYNQSR